MGILKDVFNGKKGMTGIVSEEQEKKFQEQRKKNSEKPISLQDTALLKGIERNISNPIRTGFVKGLTQVVDFIAAPNPELVNGKYTDDYDKNYEEYKKQREENGWGSSELRKTAIETIKKNREERAKYLDSNSKTDKGIMIFQNILEGVSSPTNWYNPNGFITNLAWDILQGAIDTTWEKTEIDGKDIKDFGKEDLKDYAYGAATSVAIHGVTKVAGRYISKKINKLKNSDADVSGNTISNAVEETPNTPLEVIQNEVDKYGPGATNPKAVIELAERLENGETVGIERGKNFSQEVDDFYTNVTEKRIEKIHKEELSRQNTIKNKESNAKFEERIFNGEAPEKKIANDINAKDSLSKTLKPIKNKIKLNSKQLTAEYKSRLAYIHMENGGSANFSRIGDLNELIITENSINGKTFKGMIRGYADIPENLDVYSDEFRNIGKEYLELRRSPDVTKSKDIDFDIVYDKNTAMSNLNLALNIDEIEPKKIVVDGILKNNKRKVYLTEREAFEFAVGDKAGMYILPSDDMVIKKLRNDINATTQDVKRYGNGKLVDFESKEWEEVALQNAPFPEMEDYFKKRDLFEEVTQDTKILEKEYSPKKKNQEKVVSKIEKRLEKLREQPKMNEVKSKINNASEILEKSKKDFYEKFNIDEKVEEILEKNYKKRNELSQKIKNIENKINDLNTEKTDKLYSLNKEHYSKNITNIEEKFKNDFSKLTKDKYDEVFEELEKYYENLEKKNKKLSKIEDEASSIKRKALKEAEAERIKKYKKTIRKEEIALNEKLKDIFDGNTQKAKKARKLYNDLKNSVDENQIKLKNLDKSYNNLDFIKKKKELNKFLENENSKLKKFDEDFNTELKNKSAKNIESIREEYVEYRNLKNENLKNSKKFGKEYDNLKTPKNIENLEKILEKEKNKLNKINIDYDVKKREINIRRNNLGENIEEFLETTENKAIDWLDGVFNEMNVEVDPVESLNRMYKSIIDEKSGLNVLKYRLGGNLDTFQAKVQNTNTGKMMYFQNNKTLKEAIANETEHLFELGADVSTRKFSDMSVSGKTMYNTRNLMMYKFLSNLNYLKEIATNKERINSGLIDLGFNERVGFLQSTKEMTRATKNVAKKYQNLKNIDLDTITNPLERLQIEAYIDKVMETEIDMRGYSKSNFLKNAGELGAKGQTASDIQRIALAEYFTANAMYDEFTKFKIEDVTPTMKQVLFDIGIDDNVKLKAIQDDILSTNSVTGLIDVVKDRNNTSTVKSLFQQFADINGKELNAFSGHTVGLKADSFVSRTWANFNGMFRMYNMNLLTRTFDRLTTYIDSDGFTRYRFLNDGKLSLTKTSFTGLSEWKASSRIFNSGTTALQTAGLVYGVGWLTGKITGTSKDEMIEAKMDALMHGEIKDTILDVVTTGLVDNTGLEITMGGENVVASFFNQNFKGLKRDMSSNLSPIQKIVYGSLYLVSPNAVSRGIDNIKFEKNIPNRLDTASEYLKEKWKYEYKEKAQAEQDEGLLPIEKLGLAGLGLLYESGKKAFDSVLKEKTDYQEYFEKHPEQAERFGEFKEDTPQEAKITLASGIMELAEYGARNEQLDEILSTADTVEEREKELKEYGMDYQTQLTKMDKNNKLVFHAVMSYAEIESPETIILAMNEFNELKTKEEREAFLSNFIREDQVDDFNNFLDRVMEDKNKKMDSIYDRDYSYGTEGYIEFLQTLRNEM